ncbi:MAG: putative rane protein [Caulobacteraceae bacterium]|nr:putative rane protein [Caulobacteraceae bacterium]
MGLFAEVALDLGAAWLAGGLIGMERSFHGRAAGFRTHALVSIASAAAAMVCLAPVLVPGAFPGGPLRLDPGRMAQGVMTGVGFLGAGVIFKEGVNVQGLTTAASVWATAALGLLFGLGEFLPGVLGTAAVLATLLGLRWVEAIMPSPVYAWSVFRFNAVGAPTSEELIGLLASKGVVLAGLSYGRTRSGDLLEFSGNLKAATPGDFRDVAAYLRTLEGLVEFELSRISK